MLLLAPFGRSAAIKSNPKASLFRADNTLPRRPRNTPYKEQAKIDGLAKRKRKKLLRWLSSPSHCFLDVTPLRDIQKTVARETTLANAHHIIDFLFRFRKKKHIHITSRLISAEAVKIFPRGGSPM